MKFNHSPSRVTYTYHHDLVRARLDGGMSRLDVAVLSQDADEVVLYASALTYLLENHSHEFRGQEGL